MLQPQAARTAVPPNWHRLCSSHAVQLSLLHVEEWTVLSHNYGVYTSLTDPTKTITTSGQCNIRGGGEHTLAASECRTYKLLRDGTLVLPSNHCSSSRQQCLHTHPLQTAGKDFVIPANHRVVRVRAEAGWQRWAAGATCLNFLEFEVAPGE